MNFLQKTYFFFFLISFNLNSSFSQILVPEIKNYSVEDYQADHQNWGIDVNDEGTVFVANNSGLLVYKGLEWERYFLPNNAIIRSVLCVNDRIYTGSLDEFGFWKENIRGIYEYTSLNHLFSDENSQLRNQFWEIESFEQYIALRSYEGGIYIYDGKKIIRIPDSFDIDSMVFYKKKLILGSLKRGLFVLDQDRLVPYSFQHQGKDFFSSVRILERVGSNLFVFDQNKGGYLLGDNQLTEFPKNINVFFNENLLNKVSHAGAFLYFGTIKKGIVRYSFDNKQFDVINKSNGLQNNTVLGMVAKHGFLWCSFDNGISRVELENSISFYNDFSGVLGTVYDVVKYNNRLYIASNTGLYMLDSQNKLNLVTNSEGQVWDLIIINNNLYCGHNDGLKVLFQDRLVNTYTEAGGVLGIFSVPNSNDQYLLATYTGVKKIHFEGNVIYAKQISSLLMVFDNIAFESPTILWASHLLKGLYRVELNEELTRVLKINEYSENLSSNQNKSHIIHQGDSLIFTNHDKKFLFNSQSDSLIELSPLLPVIDSNCFGYDFNRLQSVNSIFKSSELLEKNFIWDRFVKGFERVNKIEDNLFVINLIDGIMVVDSLKITHKFKKTYKKRLSKLHTLTKYIPINQNEFIIPFNEAREIRFEINTVNHYETLYRYQLLGGIQESKDCVDGTIVFQNLRHGEYVLKVLRKFDSTSVPLLIKFEVLPPWYLSITLKIIYFFFLILIGFGIYLIYRKNVNKYKRKAYKKYALKIQDTIYKLEKQNLENELKNKTIELVGFAEANVEKNEIIMVLSNELQRAEKGDLNKSRILKALETSKVHLKKNREWNVFKKNFDELNTDFLNKLIQEFPKMTTKDLRLCAYIKTGLSSKEIAPLLGISVRGVEHHRNRLRKKMNINPKEKLSFFLEHYNEKTL